MIFIESVTSLVHSNIYSTELQIQTVYDIMQPQTCFPITLGIARLYPSYFDAPIEDFSEISHGRSQRASDLTNPKADQHSDRAKGPWAGMRPLLLALIETL